jgi:hypothetical protein
MIIIAYPVPGMKPTKKFLHHSCIFAFIYVVLCPAVHQVDAAVCHHIIITSESRLQQRECLEDSDSNPVHAFMSLQIASLEHILALTNPTVNPLPFKLFRLNALSAVRLNL